MLARDRAFLLAYPLLMLVLLVTVVVLVVALSDIQRTVIQADTEVGRAGYFIDLLGLVGLAVWVTLWGVYLPTGVLAWCEPDALDPDPDELAPAVPEVVRDALLAVASPAAWPRACSRRCF